MTEDFLVNQRIWHRYTAADGTWRSHDDTVSWARPSSSDLAVLRRGLGRPAGTILEMFPFYTCPVDDLAARRGEVSAEQEAEHSALALYGLHQQGQDQPMHREQFSLGRSMLVLRRHERTSGEAIDSRFQQIFSAGSTGALQQRLRGLIVQLRDIRQPLDYTRLTADLCEWSDSDSRAGVRRRWGLDYYDWTQDSRYHAPTE
ncbi:type I-E CRISPR-associated protein Cse2/CasB [Streptomyces sp. ADI93-02]|uniref:type I-E CRISPR-associated protein Cse2/CasB n=1 Tax=Streptomyces sp. ADI93-02 TaxID=1522757 RepID=UPI000F54CDBF|nr:type I-E CRISPR-associated protein Cse2/CasB [Streptomyces sp. ADI93-02]RPK33125.1 CRISPR-associated protein Cse2 [Streptomyces sp. ADI93-02]